MKRYNILAIILLFSLTSFAQNKEKKYNWHINHLTFKEFTKLVLDKSNIKIYYQQEWVKNVNITLNNDSLTVLQAVRQALDETIITASYWNNDIVLIPQGELVNKLPSFDNKVTVVEETPKKKSYTASEDRYLKGRRPDVIKTIQIGVQGGTIERGKAKVLGRVLDEETGEPISYATVYIEETKSGAVTGNNGFFVLMLKPGKYTAVFNILGFQQKKFLLNVLSNGNFTVQLAKKMINIKEVVVHGDRQMNVNKKDPGIEKIPVKSIKELPMMMGERDIIKVSATLPGIIDSEGSSGLNVRGGGADQNAFYIDEIPIYNTAHLFGFFPAFNSDIIKDFSIYKGYIPAQYGGRLSSVFNIVTRQGNMKHFTAHGGVSPIAGNLVVEGPIVKNSLSYIFSGRSTYSDWILKKIKDVTINQSQANFYDFSGGLNFDSQKTQVSLFMYRSNDHFRLSDINDYSYGNTGASMIISHNFSNSLRGTFSFIGSQYGFETIDKQEITTAYSHSYKLEHYEFKAGFKQVLTNKHTLAYGLDAILYKLDRGMVEPYGRSSLRKEVDLGNEKGIAPSLYISDNFEVNPRLTLMAGARLTLFVPLGPQNVYLYDSGLPMDLRYVSDSIAFGQNQAITKYFEPDLRLAVNYKLDENTSVKFAFNQMHQNLFMLNNTISVAPNAQWKLADYHIKPSHSNQISLGLFHFFNKSDIEASVEMYYKEEYNYPEFKDGASFLSTSHTETAVLQGNVKAYGIEFLIKRSNRKLDGWLSYTYSRSLVKVDGGEVWNSINYGLTYPSNYDIPHVANLVMNYHLSRRISFSTIVTYQSGKPVTYPISVYYNDGYPYLEYSKRNAYRIPDYFRMDLSMSIEGNLRRKKFLHNSLLLSVYNVTGRKNAYSVFFKTDNGRIESYKYSVIGVPIFTVTWVFKLGNYAAD
ncbi:MAG: TonB-dependent receptor [Bacteroidales bacterium]|nr:TonB-dependent receptor [Bacteroidales bacterium]